MEEGDSALEKGAVAPVPLSSGKVSTQSKTTAKKAAKEGGKASTKIVKEEPDIDYVGPPKKKKTKSGGKKRKKSGECEEEEDKKNKTTPKSSTFKIKEEPEEYMEAWPSNEKRAKSGANKGKSCKENEEKERVYTLVVTDDAKNPLHDKANVYCEGNDIWDCKLYQTNIGKNNNKYYLIQLLKEKGQNTYHMWWRWGRVGYKNQEDQKSYGENLNEAKKQFRKKFKEKTKNNWHERENFKTFPEKYDLLAIDYETEGTGGDGHGSIKSKTESSDQIVPNECGNPPGKYMYKISSEHIEAGISALNTIEDSKEEAILTEAWNEFYTKIPHNFGMKFPELIKDKATVKSKRQLLEDLREKTFDSLAFWEEPQQRADSCDE